MPNHFSTGPSSKYGICLTSIIRNEKRLKKQFSKFQKIPLDCLREIDNIIQSKQKLTEQIELLNLFLYVHGTGFLIPLCFRIYPHLHKLTMGKIFQLCYVASVYGFAAGNPKHPLREHVIRTLQQDNNAAEDFKQLAAFMMLNYKGDVLDDMVKKLQGTRTGAIMLGVTNWLLLELIGDHQPWEVIQMTDRIVKFLCALSLDDLIAKQMKPIIDMRNEGISLSDIREYFAAKQTIEFSKYL